MVNRAPFPEHDGSVEGPVYRVAGEVIAIKATATETGGAYALCESRTAPAGGLPPHLYRYDDIAVFVLEGAYTAQIGVRETLLTPGAYVFVPRETMHAFRNGGTAPARMLVLVSPGDIYERFVAAVGHPAGREDVPVPGDAGELGTLVAVGPTYGFEFDSLPEHDHNDGIPCVATTQSPQLRGREHGCSAPGTHRPSW